MKLPSRASWTLILVRAMVAWRVEESDPLRALPSTATPRNPGRHQLSPVPIQRRQGDQAVQRLLCIDVRVFLPEVTPNLQIQTGTPLRFQANRLIAAKVPK